MWHPSVQSALIHWFVCCHKLVIVNGETPTGNGGLYFYCVSSFTSYFFFPDLSSSEVAVKFWNAVSLSNPFFFFSKEITNFIFALLFSIHVLITLVQFVLCMTSVCYHLQFSLAFFSGLLVDMVINTIFWLMQNSVLLKSCSVNCLSLFLG